MRISVHIYNYKDKPKHDDRILFKAKTQLFNGAVQNTRPRYAPRLPRQDLQKMRKIQLPLCDRKRSRRTLSFCQYARAQSHHDLYLSQKPGKGQKSIGKLSNCSTHYRRDQHGQSRSFNQKGNPVGRRVWTLKGIFSPSLMVLQFVSLICSMLIWWAH